MPPDWVHAPTRSQPSTTSQTALNPTRTTVSTMAGCVGSGVSSVRTQDEPGSIAADSVSFGDQITGGTGCGPVSATGPASLLVSPGSVPWTLIGNS